jgi:hypothetical protein
MPFDHSRRLVIATLAALAVPATAPMAQIAHEDATPPADPGDVAYLRVITPVGETARIDGRNLVPAPDAPSSPYAAVDATPEIVVADVRATLDTPVGGHYSYLWGMAGSGTLVQDVMPATEDEAVIRLYNLSSASDLELWIAGQDGASIADVEPISGDAIAMVPGVLTAEIRVGEELVGVIEDVDLAAGQGLSIAVWGDPGSLGFETFTDAYE